MPAPRRERVEYYRRHGAWRWRVRARNGRVLSVSSEGYTRFIACQRALVLTRDALLYVVPTGGPAHAAKLIVATAAAQRI